MQFEIPLVCLGILNIEESARLRFRTKVVLNWISYYYTGHRVAFTSRWLSCHDKELRFSRLVFRLQDSGEKIFSYHWQSVAGGRMKSVRIAGASHESENAEVSFR
jgi:hypothetical protein